MAGDDAAPRRRQWKRGEAVAERRDAGPGNASPRTRRGGRGAPGFRNGEAQAPAPGRGRGVTAALRLAWGVALLLGLLLMASGCGVFYTAGDRAMVSGAREHLRRVGVKVEGGPALPGIVEADKNLAAMEERHGRSAIDWPEEDAAFVEANTEKRGAYKQTTAWWAALRAGLTGILGLLAGNPWTAGLGALFAAAVPLLLAALRRKAQAEKAGLDAFDKLAEATGATKAQKVCAGATLKSIYDRRRKATP